MGKVKNGCGKSGIKTQKWIDGIKSFFFHGDRKAKVGSTIFAWAWSKMAMAFQFTRPWYLLYLKNEFLNWADFLNADAIIFG